MKQQRPWLQKTWKWCLAILLVFSLMPVTAFAEEEILVLDLTQGNIVIKQDGYQIDGGSVHAYEGAYTIIGNATSTDHTITVESNDADITLDQVIINSDRKSPLTIQNGAHATIHLSNVNRLGTGWDGVHATNIVVGDQASLIIDGDGSLTCNESLFYHKLSIGNGSSVSLNGGTIDLRASYVSVVDGAGTLIVNGADVRLRSDPYNASSSVSIFSNDSVMIQSGTVEIYEKNVTFGNNSDLCITGGTLYSSLSGFQLDAASLTLDGGLIQLDGTISGELKTDSGQWHGLVFEGKQGQVYGSYTLDQDLSVPSGKSIEVSTDSELIVPEDVTLRLNGNCVNNGTIINNGTIYLGLSSTYEGSKPENHPLKYEGSFSYIDEQGQTKQCQDPMVLFGEDTVIDSGWYLANGNQEIDHRLVINGDVHLILRDESNLSLKGGIEVSEGNSLSIYAQSSGRMMGALQVNDVESHNAGIGGSSGQSGGTMTFCGGKIQVSETSNGGAGIGGGAGGSGGTIMITGGTIDAQSRDWAAGIGGGDGGSSGMITITGGEITAIGSGDSGAGIGAGNNGTVDTITISGGTIHANGVHGAGIGGSYQHGAGTIIISGGTINASSEAGAGIGSGNEGSGGQVLISGGWIHADSIYGAGIGDGSYASQENGSTLFETGEDGNAVIYASSISDQSQKEGWHGIIFEDQAGAVYGQYVMIDQNFEIPYGTTLSVYNGSVLEITDTVMIQNDGAFQVYLGGQFIGHQPTGNKVSYEIAWDSNGDGTIDETTWEPYGSLPSHSDGVKEQTDEHEYSFTGWSPSIEPVKQPMTYTALFDQFDRYYTVDLVQGDGFIVESDASKVTYGKEVHITITVKPGYSKLDEFAVYANGDQLEANADGTYDYVVKKDTTITVEGIKDVKAPLIQGVEDGETYYTTRPVSVEEENIDSITVNGISQSTDFVLKGNTETTYVITAKDLAGNCTTYTVYMKTITSLKEQLGDVTIDNVTSADRALITEYMSDLDELYLQGIFTETEKEEIETMLADAEALKTRIEAAEEAANSEAIRKAQSITSQTVQLNDRDDLMTAKEAIVSALDTYGKNYTDEERYSLNSQQEQIDQLLQQIDHVGKIQDAIAQLPQTVEIDDEDMIKPVEQIYEAFNALNDHEKEMISSDLNQKINRLYQGLSNYEIIQGEDAVWQKGTQTGLTIIANGAAQRVQALLVDGQTIASDQYELRSGSTILLLRPSYLETLDEGIHTLTFVYDHGSVKTTFTIKSHSQEMDDELDNSGSDQPSVSEDTNVDSGTSNQSPVWMVILVGICIAAIGTIYYQKKKK